MNLNTRRITHALLGLAGLAATAGAGAQEAFTYITNWYAQAEHGGYYQALATGLYKKYNLDVTIKMGGPQVNALQMLVAGQTDIMMGYDFQALKAIDYKYLIPGHGAVLNDTAYLDTLSLVPTTP